MRVLHVINSLSGSGGAENGFVREVTRFNSDVEQLVVRLFPPDELEPHLIAAGIQSMGLDLNSGNSGWNWIAGARQVASLARTFKPQVIHSSLATANLVAQVAAQRMEVPVLSTFTLSGEPALMRRYQPGAATGRARVLRRIEARSARRDYIYFRALSMDAKASNSEALGIDEARTVVIPRGVPAAPDRTLTRSDLALPEDGFLVLNVGRQTAQKGHGDLIEAFCLLRKNLKSHLVIIGRSGDSSRQLKQAIAFNKLLDEVTVVPYTDDPYAYYQIADVMLFPSFMEGLGTAVLEAMACSLPVISYDIPPVREILGDSEFGTLVPVGDVTALVSSALELHASPDSTRSRAQRALARVTELYSLEKVADLVEKELRKVAASRTH